MSFRLGQEIRWNSYARSYDFLADNNPSYFANLEMVSSFYDQFVLPSAARVLDIGAGTGNFTARLARSYPSHSFVHLDASPAMIEHAATKYRNIGLKNIRLVTQSVFDFDPGSEKFDVVVCINALYAICPQERLLEKIRGWLKPDGRFVVIDFGRRQRVGDWASFLIRSTIREKGLIGALAFIASGLGALIENARGARGQSSGGYWLHSTEEFVDMLTNNGFAVEQVGVCYRGYCDWAVCQLNPSPSP